MTRLLPFEEISGILWILLRKLRLYGDSHSTLLIRAVALQILNTSAARRNGERHLSTRSTDMRALGINGYHTTRATPITRHAVSSDNRLYKIEC